MKTYTPPPEPVSATRPFTESELRFAPNCFGCGQAKDFGLVVCWDCFKRSEAFIPLKYFIEDHAGDLGAWQAHVRKRLAEQAARQAAPHFTLFR